MSINILGTLNWPGGGLNGHETKVTGDDRFGFDEAAGTAWVLDGATDLGPYRLIDREESDAAWLAETLNRELMSRNPANFESLPAFFEDMLAGVRKQAIKKTRVKLETAEKSTLPIASGMWMWREGERVHFVRLGDCIALVQTPDGKTEVFEHSTSAARETETSRQLNAMSADEKLKGLRDIRAIQNTEPQYAIFGLSPHAIDNLHIETRELPEGSYILLMSDGLWRIVDVYKMMSAEDMMAEAISGGIEGLARKMRAHEKDAARDHSVRIKSSDDACGVLAQI